MCVLRVVVHELKLFTRQRKILGLDEESILFEKNSIKFGTNLTNLYRGLLAILMVHSDICEPIDTGDVQAPLLRTVALGTPEFIYGSNRVKSLYPCPYIPLLLILN